MEIGKKIKELRRQKKITLVELSNNTGVAQATLSRIENGIMKGTLDSHHRIANALGVSLAELYESLDDRMEKVFQQNEDKRETVTLRNGKIRSEILTQHAMKKKITPLMLTFEARAESDTEKLDRGVEKFFWVLEGEILVKVGKKDFLLKEGETIYFDASLPHQTINHLAKKARVFCAISPPVL